MKAYVLEKTGSPDDSFTWKEVPLPIPKPNEVRIKVLAFGLNYADIMARQGLYREMPPIPCVLGYDVEGIVDEVGSEVSEFLKGDRVFALTRFGGYAEYAVSEQLAVGHLPEDALTGIGCALATQTITAYHAAIHVQSLMPGEKVLIHAAAGGVGTSLIQLAQWKGCVTIGVAGGEQKVKYLKSLGVDHIIDHQQGDYIDYIKEHLGGKVDAVFDNVGGKSVQKAKSILAHGGRIISYGAASISGKKGPLNLLNLVAGFGLFSPIAYLGKSQSLIGVNMLKIADYRPDIIGEEFKAVIKLYHEGVLKPHIDQVFDNIAAAHAYMEARKSIGKVVVSLPPTS